jgi:gas vesicle protein
MGLLTGTVLGAGLGMLFAPKAGSELRNQLSEQAGNLAHTASDGYRRATETAGQWASQGREVGRDLYERAREAVGRGTDEAQRYVREATAASSPAPSGSGAQSYPGSTAESIRGSQTGGATYGSSSEQTRGRQSTGGSSSGSPGSSSTSGRRS